ncbi:MAG TPA: hypothetical protein VGO61_14475 [Steroidobacteraceae bacterium]|jgi:hypothetical protein|nr:hypothetical protein [Steroidobacteraceae bacterium]
MSARDEGRDWLAYMDWQHDKDHLVESAQTYMAKPTTWRRVYETHGRGPRGELLRAWGVHLGWFDAATQGVGMITDIDGLLVHPSGLALLLEFKHDSEHDNDPNKLRKGQFAALAGLAISGLVTSYAVKYEDAGDNDRLPAITAIRRITDPFARASRWQPADFGDLLLEVAAWSRNAMNRDFVYRQKVAASLSQRYQLRIRDRPPHRKTDAVTHEALRLTARDMREGVLSPECAERLFKERVEHHYQRLWDDLPGPTSRT